MKIKAIVTVLAIILHSQSSRAENLGSFLSGDISIDSNLAYKPLYRDQWSVSASEIKIFFALHRRLPESKIDILLSTCDIWFRAKETTNVGAMSAIAKDLFSYDRATLRKWQHGKAESGIIEETLRDKSDFQVKRYFAVKSEVDGRSKYRQLTDILFYQNGRIYTGLKDCQSTSLVTGSERQFLENAAGLVVHTSK